MDEFLEPQELMSSSRKAEMKTGKFFRTEISDLFIRVYFGEALRSQ
jgi:hypothetical protein